jgi:transglutaminase-like putative cysteine protease
MGLDGPDEPADPPASRTAGEATTLNALSPDERTGVGGSIDPDRLGGANDTHFVVETERPTYYRTGAYDRYTGHGWARKSDPSVYSGGLPSDDDEVRQRVRLKRPATGLPAAYRPISVRFPDREQPTVMVSERRSFRVERGVEAGTEYVVTSDVSSPDPERLRNTSRNYPPEVERYAGRPPATTESVVRLSDRVTSEADGPYEEAVAIERWLESSKRYRLDTGRNGSSHVVDEFLFEMDGGYCEHFATSMVVMLRSQGIPARYVVGYGPGTKTATRDIGDEDTYRVRSIDAHAWVEVYFEGVGWVRFDPTPASQRTIAERQVLAGQGVGRDARPVVAGSPDERSRDDGGDDDSGLTGSEAESLEPRAPPYDVSLNESPVPGKGVTVQVTKDGLPVTGAVVTFNGEPVGWTNTNGVVVATVPYAERLTVDAKPSFEARVSAERRGSEDADVVPGPQAARAAAGGSIGPPGVDGTSSGPGAFGGVEPSGTTPDDGVSPADGDDERTYDLPTEVRFVTRGTPAPGRSFRLVPMISNVPIRNATVTFDGELVGRTGADLPTRGVRIDVPRDASGSATVTVERGEIAASTTIDLEELRITLEPETGVPLPRTGATAVVTVGDVPVEGASVYADGRYIGETDENGRVDLQLPSDDDVRLSADGPYQSSSRVIAGLHLYLGSVVAFLLTGIALLVGVPLVVSRRRGRPVSEVLDVASDLLRTVGEGMVMIARPCWRLLARTWSFAVRGGVWLSRAAVSTALLVGTTLLSVLKWTVGSTGAIGTVLTDLVVRVGIWVADRSARERLVDLVGMARGALGLAAATVGAARGLLIALIPFTGVALGDVLGTAGRGSRDETTTGDDGSTEQTGGATDPSLVSVREAWRRFLDLVPLGRYRTKTPGEIGRAAVDRGYPAGPVDTLVEAFRAVEYGGRADGPDLRERVTDAIRRLADRPDGRDDESASGGGDG